MRSFHRIGIGCLVGLCFAAGYAARLSVDVRERAAAEVREKTISTQGARIASAGLEGAAGIDFRPIETLYSVLTNVREHYVEQLSSDNESQMTYGALRAMLSSLGDSNTRFLDPTQSRIVRDAVSGKFHGIGAVLGIRKVRTGDITDEHLIVLSVISTGPADRAGLKPGDDIVSVDGKQILPFNPFQKAEKYLSEERKKNTKQNQLRKWLDTEEKRIESGMPVSEAEIALITEDGKTRELSVRRAGVKSEIKIKVAAESFGVEPVTSKFLDSGAAGYVRINCFVPETGSRFAEALSELRAKGARGMVLDLRKLSGGETDSVLNVARHLLPGRKLGVLLQSRGRRCAINVPDAPADQVWDGRISVLVDSGTVRFPELLAASLKEQKRARLVGEQTCGDNSHSSVMSLSDGSAVMMKTGVLLSSMGVSFAKGVKPDVRVAYSGDGSNQLSEAVKALGEGGARQ